MNPSQSGRPSSRKGSGTSAGSGLSWTEVIQDPRGEELIRRAVDRQDGTVSATTSSPSLAGTLPREKKDEKKKDKKDKKDKEAKKDKEGKKDKKEKDDAKKETAKGAEEVPI